MIVCDGWIFRSDEVESIGPIIDEGGSCWFEIRTASGGTFLITRQTARELFKQQASLFAQLAERERLRSRSR